MKSIRSILAQIVVVLMLGCNIGDLDFDNIQPPDIDGLYAVPIGEVIYTMQDLLDEVGDQSADLQKDEDSVLFLEYVESLNFASPNDIITIDDVSNSASFNLPVTPSSGSSQLVTIDTSFVFNFVPDAEQQIESILYTSGLLSLIVSTNLSNTISYTATIQNTTLNGIAVTLPGTVNNLGANPDPNERDLTNHETLLNFSGATSSFQVDFHLEITLAPGDQLFGSESFNFQLDYTNQTFSEIHGKFGQDTVNLGSATLDIPFFSGLEGEGLKIGAPIISFNFTNSFGVPLGVLFGGVYSVDNSATPNDTVRLGGSITKLPLPQIAGAATVGSSTASNITVNKSNSTLSKLLEVSPDQIGFDLKAVINPTDPSQSNFVTETGELQTDILVTLPLAIQLENLVRNVSFDLGKGLKISELDSAVLRIVTVNGLPFSGIMDVEIYNDADSLVYLAAENLILEAPFINQGGLVIQTRNNTVDIPIGSAGIEALSQDGSRLNLHFTLNTPSSLTANEIFVKIRTTDSLQAKVSVVAAVKYEL